MKTAGSLPALMYHYISRFRAKLVFSPDELENLCRSASELGWFGVGLSEAEAFLLHGEPLPKRSFLITFDDGYLDNYVYAWPILQKYGHKGVIFAVADKVSEASGPGTQLVRPTLRDVWEQRIPLEALPVVDDPIDQNGPFPVRKDRFFTWAEARVMEASGVISVAAHSLRHEAVFTGHEYTGFIQPCPSTAGFPRSVAGMLWGLPAFHKEAELSSRAFVPSASLVERLKALVPQEEGEAAVFFRDEGHVAELKKLVDSFGPNGLGALESPEEQACRFKRVMRENQDVLTKELGHSVRSFCWPWGLSCPQSLRAAQEAGFEVFYNVEPGPNPARRHIGVRRFNPKRDVRKTLSRLSIYSRPWLGELYRRIRL